jgi:hypothetical protein
MYDVAGPSPSCIYGRCWQRFRVAFLARNPLCQCEENGGTGCGPAATVVDYDPVLLYDWDNLQAMTEAW